MATWVDFATVFSTCVKSLIKVYGTVLLSESAEQYDLMIYCEQN